MLRVGEAQMLALDSTSNALPVRLNAISPRAERLDNDIRTLIQQHVKSGNIDAAPSETDKVRQEYKEKLLPQLWMLTHFEKTNKKDWPIPAGRCDLIDPIQAKRSSYLNQLGHELRIDNLGVLRESLNRLCAGPDFSKHCLELISGSTESLSAFLKTSAFEYLPKAAKQVIIDSVRFERGFIGHHDLEGLTLTNKNFGRNFDFKDCNLQNTSLVGLFPNNFSRACMDGADLSRFTLNERGKIESASLNGANFGHNLSLIGHRFHSCDLTKIKIDCSKVDDTPMNADLYLNHIHNENSFISDLKNWPQNTPAASATRAYLMQQLATGLNRERLPGSYSALTDLPMARAIAEVVLRDPKFSVDPHPEMQRLRAKLACNFLSDREPWASKTFAPGSRLDSKEVIQSCMQSAVDVMTSAKPKAALSGVLNIDTLLARSHHSEHRKLATALSDACINLLLDAGLRHDAQDLGPLCTKLRESQWARLPLELKGLLSAQGIDATAHDFFIEQNDSRTHCVAFDDSYMKSLNNIMADKTAVPGFDWKNVYLFEKKHPGQWEGPNAVGRSSAAQDPVLHDLQSFSIDTCYRRQAASLLKEKANQLFELAATSGASGVNDFSLLFSNLRQQASQTQQSERMKWLSAEKSNHLAEILGSCMCPIPTKSANAHPMSPGSMRLTPAHIEDLNRLLNVFCDADPSTRARWFFALGTTYTRLSSSTFMGTEVDSPLPVRTYAAALLGHARELDPEIFRNKHGTDQFQGWHAQLCGEGQAFTCTAMLSNRLKAQCQEHPRDDAMKTAFATVYPSSWT